jgi:hypothetical protein
MEITTIQQIMAEIESLNQFYETNEAHYTRLRNKAENTEEEKQTIWDFSDKEDLCCVLKAEVGEFFSVRENRKKWAEVYREFKSGLLPEEIAGYL